MLKRLQDGEIVALVSDAGTPGISDPGTELVSSFGMILLSLVIARDGIVNSVKSRTSLLHETEGFLIACAV